jgi:GWxTD domain-containing protein
LTDITVIYSTLKYKSLKKIVFVGVMMISAFRALGQEVDYSHLYNPNAELSVDHQIIEEENNYTLQFSLKINNRNYQLYDYDFELYNLDNYNSSMANPLPEDSYDSVYLETQGSLHRFKYAIRLSQSLPLLVLEVRNKKTSYSLLFDIPLYDKGTIRLSSASSQQGIKNWSAPALINFSSDKIHGFYYNESFPTGLPPMVTRDNFNDKELKVDSSFISRESIQLKNKGLYLLMTDTSGNDAVALRIVDVYFPKLTTIEQLVEPLKYITSREEQTVLEGIQGDKRKFDRFWLNLAGSASRAKDIIKVYYSRVEEANALFTTYKEGWRTDMGMIYSVMGPPDEVIKSFNEETWVYLANRNLPKRKYTFIRAASLFSKSHFVLIREKKHAESWFETIDLLRKGIFK